MGKLVRDRIPEMERRRGARFTVQVLNDADFQTALRQKIVEEAGEVHDATTDDALVEELADLLEVILALADTVPGGMDSVLRARRAKRGARGGFDERVWMDDYRLGIRLSSGPVAHIAPTLRHYVDEPVDDCPIDRDTLRALTEAVEESVANYPHGGPVAELPLAVAAQMLDVLHWMGLRHEESDLSPSGGMLLSWESSLRSQFEEEVSGTQPNR